MWQLATAFYGFFICKMFNVCCVMDVGGADGMNVYFRPKVWNCFSLTASISPIDCLLVDMDAAIHTRYGSEWNDFRKRSIDIRLVFANFFLWLKLSLFPTFTWKNFKQFSIHSNNPSGISISFLCTYLLRFGFLLNIFVTFSNNLTFHPFGLRIV